MKSRLSFSPRRTLVLHVLLVLSLLLAQGAAYAHVVAHLKAPAEVSGLDAKATQLCSVCLEGAPLLGGAGAPHVPSVVQLGTGVASIAVLACAPVATRTVYAFRSRAPPPSL